MLRPPNDTNTLGGSHAPVHRVGKAATYAISGSDLTITDADEGTMQFVSAS